MSRTENLSCRTLRDGPFGAAIQAINCLATFMQSLRDKKTIESTALAGLNTSVMDSFDALVLVFRSPGF